MNRITSELQSTYSQAGQMHHVDLRNEDITALDLSRTQIEKCSFSQCRFSNCIFGELHSCSFSNCQLYNVRFGPTNNCNFVRSAIESVKFDYRLSACDFTTATLRTVHFADQAGRVNVQNVFCEATLESVDAAGASLSGSNFSDSRIRNSRFSRALLLGASFERASLYRVNLINSKLHDAKWARSEFQMTLMGAVDGLSSQGVLLASCEGCSRALNEYVGKLSRLERHTLSALMDNTYMATSEELVFFCGGGEATTIYVFEPITGLPLRMYAIDQADSDLMSIKAVVADYWDWNARSMQVVGRPYNDDGVWPVWESTPAARHLWSQAMQGLFMNQV